MNDGSTGLEFEGEGGVDEGEGTVVFMVVAVVAVAMPGCTYVLRDGVSTAEEAGDVKTVEVVVGDEKIFDDGVEGEVVCEVDKPFLGGVYMGGRTD